VVQVNLSGVGLAPNLALAPNGRDFGSQTENTSGSAQLFAVTNSTGAPVAINDATIAGANSDQFRLSSDTCLETTLPAGGECQVGVRFAPDSTGAKTATLRVNGAGESLSAPLTGSGIESTPTPAPSNTFSLEKFKTNTKKGTATLSVSVPGAGRLQLSGGGVKQTQKTSSQKANISLPITPNAQTASQLDKSGNAKVTVTVSFTPGGGSPGKKAKTYKLVKTQ
jgi:hypothetical protein